MVKAINSTAYDDSDVGLLVGEIKLMIDLNFNSFECNFIGRACNRAAHELAALGYQCSEGEEVISFDVPYDVSVIVAKDFLAVE